MALRHTNPTQKRYDRKSGQFIEARAPYNFIPLPEKIIAAPDLLSFDVYHSEALSCWIDVDMETRSPTYVRGMMTQQQFKSYSGKGSSELTREEKEELADPFKVDGVPVIPGSSLRGMIRSIVEIASYGRIRWVAKAPTFSFRAVAAQKDDPLAEPYQEIIGKFAANVRAGYLKHSGEDWFVQPAKLPRTIRGCEDAREKFLKIKEDRIGSQDIPGFTRLSSKDYRPAWYRVKIDASMGRTRFGKSAFVNRIGGEGSRYDVKGTLVCSGNMAESGQKTDARSKRTTHTLILEPDLKQKRIKISKQAIKDYLAGLTPFQRDNLNAWSKDGNGCLADDAPVFYVLEGDEVAYFGHSPNFRISMRLSGSQHAATPNDFIPLEMRNEKRPDFADAIFGWVQDSGDDGDSPPEQRAGRVSFGDARCISDLNDIWWKERPIAPHTLASPKPTTFQHYLVQDKLASHDPDAKTSLAHYGTSPSETQIRGFKRYWHKGATPDIEASEKERALEKQLTRIKPLKVGVRFKFRIHLESLRPTELGALLWAITLPGELDKEYAHKIGMGKPLGMGAVRLSVTGLRIVNRRARYGKLFAQHTWQTAEQTQQPETYIRKFENYVLDELGQSGEGKRRLAELERIQMLLTMHEWAGPISSQTRYMSIELGDDRDTINEYKERPVLPGPLAVRSIQPQNEPANQRARNMNNPIPAQGYETGVVKKFGLGAMKDFGFIAPDTGGEDVYVNRSKLSKGLQTLSQGQRVRYMRVPSAKGFQAIDVQVVG